MLCYRPRKTSEEHLCHPDACISSWVKRFVADPPNSLRPVLYNAIQRQWLLGLVWVFFFLFSNAGSRLSYNAFNTKGYRYITVTDNELSPCVSGCYLITKHFLQLQTTVAATYRHYMARSMFFGDWTHGVRGRVCCCFDVVGIPEWPFNIVVEIREWQFKSKSLVIV